MPGDYVAQYQVVSRVWGRPTWVGIRAEFTAEGESGCTQVPDVFGPRFLLFHIYLCLCSFVHTLGKQPEGETTTICLKKSWTNSFSWRYWEAVEYNILTRAYCISQLVVDRYGCFNGRCRYWTGWPMVYIMQLLLFFITHQRCHPPLTSARSKFKFKVQNILLHGEWRAWGWGEPDWRGRLQICLHTFIRPSAGIGWCPSSQGGR